MALKYSVTHNGNTWNSSTNASSISISNGSATTSMTAAGTKTLNCKGKIAANNLVIGAKTLNCKGKIMTANVVITAQEAITVLTSADFNDYLNLNTTYGKSDYTPIELVSNNFRVQNAYSLIGGRYPRCRSTNVYEPSKYSELVLNYTCTRAGGDTSGSRYWGGIYLQYYDTSYSTSLTSEPGYVVCVKTSVFNDNTTHTGELRLNISSLTKNFYIVPAGYYSGSWSSIFKINSLYLLEK